uniref:Retrovirus-related Pol polyprotein from transposon TNT 1-94 n=1 Tax=Tanacetum cinerariifolium TaxID=118510 RepID=A0A6L2K2U2_TANCI|nr:retrovirus-related Pol polyprotein from transposon TNT 1-94 [Tanacetum cinerariifolium]
MCDNKNSVLFTDTACVVLSPDFKLTDESHVLLKVPRKDNMYSVDLKNVVPQGGLTCLFVKATSDESSLWHRRLRHVNFKTKNKLVKGNLARGRKPALSFMGPFVYPVTILNTTDHLGKFDGKADEGFFVGYFTNSKAIRVFNSRTRIVKENLHVKFNENTPNIAGSGPNWIFDIDKLTKSMNYKTVVVGNQSNGCACKARVDTDSPSASYKTLGEEEKNDIEDPGNEDSKAPITEEPRFNQEKDNVNSTNKVNAASSTVNAASNEVNVVWDCDKEQGKLVAQGHTQEGIDCDEVFASVARIEAIRLFLAYASFKDFVVYQMDVKSAFLYGNIKEEVYVCQPLRFKDPDFPDRVYKVEKALYGLHEAPRAWYETLSTYLLDNGFQRGMIHKTLFIKKDKSDILLVQVYVDVIIFGSTKKEMCTEFEKMKHKKFQMSSVRELTFFLGLQVKQQEDEIFISQEKYVNEILNKFGFSNVKIACTPMETHKTLLKDDKGEDVDEHLYRSMIGSLMYLTSSRPDIMFAVCACVRFQVNPKISHLYAVKRIFRYLKGQPKLGLWYPKDSPFNLVTYTDSDYAGASLDRKSTIGGCQFLGCRMISWQCKKQIMVANFTTKAKYIAASNCYGQVLWIQNQLLDYGYSFMQNKIYIDNGSTICIVKNPIFHSKTKHIKATAKAKNINGEAQIHAKVDGKKVIIFEATIRRDLKFEDKGGVDCLTNEVIFEQLTLIGPSAPQYIQKIIQPSTSKPQKKQKPRKPRRQDTQETQPSDPTTNVEDEALNEENVPTQSNDLPLSRVNTLGSGEDRLKLKELMEIYTNLQQRVIGLENTKTVQAHEISSLKRRVKRLEKKRRSRTHGLKRLYKIGLSARVESSAKEQSLGEEDASRQGRNLADIDADAEITQK